MKATTSRTASFGPYLLDLRSGELRKYGTRIKMGEQSFRILCLLLENPGELVGREELRAKLWADDTFVDFDHGLNSAVQRLRDCLSDSAGKPRWVETLPRRGYRFIGEVQWSDGAATESMPESNAGSQGRTSLVEISAVALTGSSELSSKTTSDSVLQNGNAKRRRVSVFAFVVVVLLAAFPIAKWLRDLQSKHQARLIRSIAVLPLENFSSDAGQEFFADGMTEELITMLAKNSSLRVTSRTSVMQYKKVRRPLREIAKELGVDGILEGSVGRAGNRVRVTAQLIYAPTDTNVWAESYDRDANDVNALQSEVAQAIVKQVGATTSPTGPPPKSVLPAAHDAYLLGRYYWFVGEYNKSRDAFQKAIDLQPDYAAAWSGLADAYTVSAVAGQNSPTAVLPQAVAAAKKALALDASLAEAHNAMAALDMFYLWNWREADEESLRALELNPHRGEFHHLRAYVLTALNRMDEALQEEHRAAELEPMARPWALGWALIRLHKFDEAVKELRARSEAQRQDGSVDFAMASAFGFEGKAKEWHEEWTKLLADDKEEKPEFERAFQRGGLEAGLEWYLGTVKKRSAKGYVSPFEFAQAYAQLGKREKAIHYLEESYREHAPWLVHVQHDPSFDLLHGDPRYQIMVTKMGLPQAENP
jgi:TolB-like protein/DNA-binding winged helix-turn-helix (wHTH) protein